MKQIFCGHTFVYSPQAGTWTSEDGVVVVRRTSNYVPARVGKRPLKVVYNWTAECGNLLITHNTIAEALEALFAQIAQEN